MAESTSLHRPLYRPVGTLPEEKKAHRRFWDRERQREHRAKTRNKVAGLEEEARRLAERMHLVEQERDAVQKALRERDERITELEAIVERQKTTLQSILTLANDVSQRPSETTRSLVIASPNAPVNIRDGISNDLHVSPAQPTSVARHSLLSDPFLQLGPGETIDSLTWADFADAWPLTLADDLPWPDDFVLDLPRLATPGVPQELATVPPWAALPLNGPAMCPVDAAFYELQQNFQDAEERARAVATQQTRGDDSTSGSLQNKRYLAELSTTTFPQVSSLLNPINDDDRPDDSRQLRSRSRGPSRPHRGIAQTVFARVMTQMPVVDTPGRLAAMWIVCHLVRWRLCRTQASFDALPPFLHPTTTQRTVTHPIWIDTIVWPAARDQLIGQPHIYGDKTTFDVFRTGLGRALSVSWPYSLAESLTVVPQEGTTSRTPDYCLSKPFQAHLSDLSNWMLDEAFLNKYPFLRGTVNEKKADNSQRR